MQQTGNEGKYVPIKCPLQFCCPFMFILRFNINLGAPVHLDITARVMRTPPWCRTWLCAKQKLTWSPADAAVHLHDLIWFLRLSHPSTQVCRSEHISPFRRLLIRSCCYCRNLIGLCRRLQFTFSHPERKQLRLWGLKWHELHASFSLPPSVQLFKNHTLSPQP